MKLRKAKKTDINDILVIHNQLFDYDYTYENYANELEYDIAKFMVLEGDSGLIGYFIVHVVFEVMDLVIIAIRKEFQKNNYGQFLLDYIFYLGLENNCTKIMLEVSSVNKQALAFYKKNNFEEISVRKKYYGTQDAIIMERGV